MRRLDISDMLSELTATEMAEWEAALALGIVDSAERADHRAGVIAATVANMAGMRAAGPERKASDYFPPLQLEDEPDLQLSLGLDPDYEPDAVDAQAFAVFGSLVKGAPRHGSAQK